MSSRLSEPSFCVYRLLETLERATVGSPVSFSRLISETVIWEIVVDVCCTGASLIYANCLPSLR